MLRSFKLLVIAGAGLISFNSFSQAPLVTVNGATVGIQNGAVVWVNGGFSVKNAGSVTNNADSLNIATFPVSSGIPNASPGNFAIEGGAAVQGDGVYKIERHWTNDGTFNSGISKVYLYGSDTTQLIRGSQPTSFFDLILTGVGANRIKRQQVDAMVDFNGHLHLNDRELATDNFTMNVLNPFSSAVTNSTVFGAEGFVSSTGNGSLTWATLFDSTYLFPVGSSVGTLRYRPVSIYTDAASAAYSVQLANYDATLDGWNIDSVDNSLCAVNNLYYHKIGRPLGGGNADITLFYDAAADGDYDNIAQWNQPLTNNWNNLGSVAATSGTYSSLTKSTWSNFNDQQFVIARLRPSAPSLIVSSVCEGEDGSARISPSDPNATYTWSVTNGAILNTYNDSIQVAWNTGNCDVTVIQELIAGCPSLPVTVALSVLPTPVAGFDTTQLSFFGNAYSFVDTSTGTPTIWSWDFGDGSTLSTTNNSNHNFENPGEYTVTLTAMNSQGCAASVSKLIKVMEGIKIPNVFSPNNDGSNETFYFTSSGVKMFRIKIFNRWGTMVFESEAPEVVWDGRTPSGIDAPEGTYYYILEYELLSGKKEISNRFLTLLR